MNHFKIGLICRLILLFLTLCCSISKAFVIQDLSQENIMGIYYLDNEPISIEIKDGFIEKINRNAEMNGEGDQLYIAPGFIDIQVNGYLSYSFNSEGLEVGQVKEITSAFRRFGVTTYLPTLTSNSFEIILNNFTILNEAMKDPDVGMSIPGFHLEGPYISAEDGFRGAHNLQWIRDPDWDEFMKWQEASGKNILIITLAPELEGAIDFIDKCRQENIVVALGHHNGSADIIKSAVDAGAEISTHLGNGCANFIHRHDNPLWPQLADDRLMASLIADGYHLRPEEIRTFYKVKGVERTILVSDVTSLGGMPPGNYELFGQKVVMTSQGKITMPSQDVLAGASYLITTGIENIMRFTGCSLADAVHMVSRNPARLLGLDDRGEIRVGKRADLVLFNLDNGKLTIRKTIVAGKEVFNSLTE